MPVDNVLIHKQFLIGKRNCDMFKDLLQFDFNDAIDVGYFNAIMNFIDDVLEGKELQGRNKYNSGHGYEVARAGHYHTGPYTNTLQTMQANIRVDNPNGATSGSVIHYCWHGDSNDIVLVGFSPVKHTPFPQITDKNNPLRSRVKQSYFEHELVPVDTAFEAR